MTHADDASNGSTTIGRARTPRINGLRVARETLVHGLNRAGLIVRGIEGADIARSACSPTKTIRGGGIG